MLRFSGSGLDFTDEGYYIASIADPGIYSSTASQFGFVYHPLFEFLGSDIARVRQANVLITFGLGWVLADSLLLRAFGPEGTPKWQRLTISAALATASLTIFQTWLLTPSYNSLALQAVLVTATGISLLAKPSPNDIAAGMLIGLGGGLALLAKPTTAAALGVLVLAYVLLSRPFRIVPAIVAGIVAVTLSLGSAWAIDGSISTFVTRLTNGAELARLLDGRHDIGAALRIDSLETGRRLAAVGSAIAAFLVLTSVAVLTNSRIVRWVCAGSSLVLVAGVALLGRGHGGQLLGTNRQPAMVLFSISIAAAVVGVSAHKFRGVQKVPARDWVLATVFVLLPHAYAFGSNANYWRVGGAAAIAWVFAGVVLLVSLRPLTTLVLILMAFGIAAQVLTAGLLAYGSETPYRQLQAIRDQAVSTRIGSSSLKLSPGPARYVRVAIAGAKSAGFEKRTPVIDLSGRSPTLLYALGAKSIGQPWIIGGYRGSAHAAVAALRTVSCSEISSAWILTELKGPRKVSTRVLDPFGIHFPDGYAPVASWNTAPGVAGFPQPVLQKPWQPARGAAEAEQACRAASRSKG